MKMDWSVDHVINECRKMYRGANDPLVTGFVNWPCKQDLYRVKFAVDEMLKDTATFGGETEWLEELQKEKMWQTLKQ